MKKKMNTPPGLPFTEEEGEPAKTPAAIPLAERMRPRRLEDFAGQEHLLGERKPLRQLISAGSIPSMILWGPPGTGKTTLAHLIAEHLQLSSFSFSAVLTGIKEVKEFMSDAAYISRTPASAPCFHR